MTTAGQELATKHNTICDGTRTATAMEAINMSRCQELVSAAGVESASYLPKRTGRKAAVEEKAAVDKD